MAELNDSEGVKTDSEQETQKPHGESVGAPRPVAATTGITFGVVMAIAFLSSIITAGAMLVAYDHFIAQKIVAVDLKGFIAQTRDDYLAGKITDVQMRASFDRMEAVAKAIPKNKVVLMGDAVIQGVEKIEIGSSVPSQPAASK